MNKLEMLSRPAYPLFARFMKSKFVLARVFELVCSVWVRFGCARLGGESVGCANKRASGRKRARGMRFAICQRALQAVAQLASAALISG